MGWVALSACLEGLSVEAKVSARYMISREGRAGLQEQRTDAVPVSLQEEGAVISHGWVPAVELSEAERAILAHNLGTIVVLNRFVPARTVGRDSRLRG